MDVPIADHAAHWQRGVRSEHGDNIINISAALELPRRGYESISAACLLALLAAHGVIGAIGARRGEAT